MRNTPLKELKVRYRPIGQPWRLMDSSYRIGRVSFNQLGPAWTELTEWFACWPDPD